MDVILTNDTLAQTTSNVANTVKKTNSAQGGKFEFIKGCWYIAKKLFLLG